MFCEAFPEARYSLLVVPSALRLFSFVTFLVAGTLVYKAVEIEYCTHETYIIFQENVSSIQNKPLKSSFCISFGIIC